MHRGVGVAGGSVGGEQQSLCSRSTYWFTVIQQWMLSHNSCCFFSAEFPSDTVLLLLCLRTMQHVTINLNHARAQLDSHHLSWRHHLRCHFSVFWVSVEKMRVCFFFCHVILNIIQCLIFDLLLRSIVSPDIHIHTLSSKQQPYQALRFTFCAQSSTLKMNNGLWRAYCL